MKCFGCYIKNSRVSNTGGIHRKIIKFKWKTGCILEVIFLSQKFDFILRLRPKKYQRLPQKFSKHLFFYYWKILGHNVFMFLKNI